VVIRVEAYVFQIVVLAAGADALLRIGSATWHVRTFHLPEENRDELVHAGVREQQVRRVGHQTRRRHNGVLLRLEEVEERLTDLRAGHHGNWNNKGTKKQKGRRLCLNELNFVALFLCCSAKSGGEISPKPPVKASGSFQP
jgi:hypothetical protein